MDEQTRCEIFDIAEYFTDQQEEGVVRILNETLMKESHNPEHILLVYTVFRDMPYIVNNRLGVNFFGRLLSKLMVETAQRYVRSVGTCDGIPTRPQ